MTDLMSKMRLTTAQDSAMLEQASKPAPIISANTDTRALARSIAARAARTHGLAGTIKRALEPSRITRASWKVTDPRSIAAVETQVYFDVMAANAITPLDLQRLDRMSTADFKQEVLGIITHLDRRAATFTNDYRPATALEGPA